MYPFPPDTPTAAVAVVVYLMLGLMLVPLGWATVRAFRTNEARPPRWADLVPWAVAVFVPGLIISYQVRTSALLVANDSPAAWLTGIGLAVSLLGGFVTFVRILAHRNWMNALCGAAIFMLLVAFLMPATRSVHEAASRTQCRNNLKQIGLALHNYHDTYAEFPPATWQGDDGPALSWRVNILPYLDQAPLYHAYRRSEAWDGPNNLPFARRDVYGLSCPGHGRQAPESQRDEWGRFRTDYVAITGADTIFGPRSSLSIPEVADGTANTLLVVEAAGSEIVWSEPRDLSADDVAWKVNAPGPRRGASAGVSSSYHTGGTQVLLADGSARFVSENIDAATLRSLTTAAGGEAIGDDSF